VKNSRGGFTVSEVLLTLVVGEVMLAGVLGMSVLATRQMSEAMLLDEATTALQSVADSLAYGANPGSGIDTVGSTTIEWTVKNTGEFIITVNTVSGKSLSLKGRTIE